MNISRKRIGRQLVSLFAIFAVTSATMLHATSPAGRDYVPGEVIVKFKGESGVVMKANAKGMFATSGKKSLDTRLSGLGIERTEQLMPRTGALPASRKAPSRKLSSGRVIEKVDLSKLYCLRFDSNRNVEEMVRQLSELPEVEYAEPNRLVHTCAFETDYSSDPLYSQQWGINAINLPQLWQMPATDAKRPVIAILDTGVDINHPDLVENIWTNELEAAGAEFADDDNNGYPDDLHGWDFVKNTAIINEGNDLHGHGTHCAGIAAACGNNGIGIAGANPDALIMPVRVLNDRGQGDIATIIRGADYAMASGADVMSMSFGSYGEPSKSLAESMKNASFQSILVAAAGNDGASIYGEVKYQQATSEPACFEYVIGVMSSDNSGNRSGFSNYDPDGPFSSTYDGFYNYDIMAPGSGIMSTYPGGTYKELSGTSMATPLVAGAISRMLQTNGYQLISAYGFIGDIAMSHKESSEVFDVTKTFDYSDANRDPHVAISLVIDDREFGNGDGKFDAGETIRITPVVRSVWGRVNDLTISCEIADKNIPESTFEFVENDVDFGWHLSSRGSATGKNPIVLKVNNDIPDDMKVTLRLKAKNADGKEIGYLDSKFSLYNTTAFGGIITEDITLYPDKRYVFDRNIVCEDGVTITVKGGTNITLKSDISMSGYNINFVGTSDSIITIKSENNRHFQFTLSGAFKCNYVDFSDVSFTAHHQIHNEDYYGSQSLLRHCIMSDFRASLIGWTPDFKMKIENCIIDGSTMQIQDDYWIMNNCIVNNSKYSLSTALSSCSIITSTTRDFDLGQGLITFDSPNYFGSTKESIIRENIYDLAHPTNPQGNVQFDLSNRLQRPPVGCPGHVWKVCVNGYDAQDEADMLPPLGVGRQKFEVYFNRKMNHDFTPQLAMGLQEPYTQTKIAEDGEWRTEMMPYNPFSDGRGPVANLVSGDCNNTYENEAVWRTNGCYMTLFDTTDEKFGIGFDGLCIKSVYHRSDIPNKIFQQLDLVQNGRYKLTISAKVDKLAENNDCQYVYLNDSKVYLDEKALEGAVYEVIADVRDYNIEVGIAQTENISPSLYIDNVSLTLLEEYSNERLDAVDVYTAYLTIKGNDELDGYTRITVSGARDLDNMEIPVENKRFALMVQAAGSMSSGFMAETGVGNVTLTWERPDENFDDLLGYNMYRYTSYYDEETGKTVANDTIRINERLLDAEQYVDYDIEPGTTYYYYYRVMRTNFVENSPSKVVAATPRAAGKGDANGSGAVDVADVVTEVNYMVGRDPKPFIFDAADVNGDTDIDILDVVGTVNIIMAPAGVSDMASAMNVATYTIEDGILYVDSPVELAGVQVELNGMRGATEIAVLPALNGMENTGDWVNDEAYRFVAFSLSGKTLEAGRHGLLSISDAGLSDLILVDTTGNRIVAIDGSLSGIGEVVMQQMKTPTPNPFVDVINVPVAIGTEGDHSVELSLHDLSGAKMLSHSVTLGYGEHNVTINGGSLSEGMYMLTLTIDGTIVQTHKVIKK